MLPLIKWPGGKRRLLPQLRRFVPATYGTYHEPFFGGGALYFDLCPSRAILSDACAPLMRMYGTLVRVPREVSAVVRLLQRRLDAQGLAQTFPTTRSLFNHLLSYEPGSLGRELPHALFAGLFLGINRMCFNGLWRLNHKGQFNVPVGRYAQLHLPDEPQIEAAARQLQTAKLVCADFETRGKDIQEGDFVYCDPPYLPRSKTSTFTAYTSDAFGLEQHQALARWGLHLASRGVHVVMSNSDTPDTRRIFEGYALHEVVSSRSISAAGTRRGSVPELILVAPTTEIRR